MEDKEFHIHTDLYSIILNNYYIHKSNNSKKHGYFIGILILFDDIDYTISYKLKNISKYINKLLNNYYD